MKTHVKLCIPEGTLLQHAVLLGKTGKGKSSVLRHVVEHLLSHNKRVCIIDPKGDWWGLKVGADGKSPGFPVVAFGDFKKAGVSDVPIGAHSGKQLAELVSSGNRPCMIGMSGWRTSAMTQFWMDFAENLFKLNRGELYLIGDEFHNFAPKGKILSPQAGECLHWSNRILSEGRGIGIVCFIASQRPQKVHNDTLTSCETLFALGVVHPADREAVMDWLNYQGDTEKTKLVAASLAGLQRGEAYVWSPEIKFGPELIKFPMFETFDSFAPPQLQKNVSQKGWADVDLGEVKERLAAVIEEAKANDPRELKLEIARLKSELKKSPAVAAPAKVETTYVPLLSKRQLQALDNATALFKSLVNAATKCQEEIALALTESAGVEIKPHSGNKIVGISHTIQPPRAARPLRLLDARVREPAGGDNNGHIDGAQQKILDTILMLNNRGLQPNRDMIARWMDIHPNGGRYGSNLARLRETGFLDGCELTQHGLGAAMGLESGLEAAFAAVDGTKRQILAVLKDGAEYDRDSLAHDLGIHPNGGRYGSNLAWLRTMGIIPERGTIKLTEAAFK